MDAPCYGMVSLVTCLKKTCCGRCMFQATHNTIPPLTPKLLPEHSVFFLLWHILYHEQYVPHHSVKALSLCILYVCVVNSVVRVPCCLRTFREYWSCDPVIFKVCLQHLQPCLPDRLANLQLLNRNSNCRWSKLVFPAADRPSKLPSAKKKHLSISVDGIFYRCLDMPPAQCQLNH